MDGWSCVFLFPSYLGSNNTLMVYALVNDSSSRTGLENSPGIFQSCSFLPSLARSRRRIFSIFIVGICQVSEGKSQILWNTFLSLGPLELSGVEPPGNLTLQLRFSYLDSRSCLWVSALGSYHCLSPWSLQSWGKQFLPCVIFSFKDPRRYADFSKIFSFLFVVRIEWQLPSFLYVELEKKILHCIFLILKILNLPRILWVGVR